MNRCGKQISGIHDDAQKVDVDEQICADLDNGVKIGIISIERKRKRTAR